MRDAVSHHVFFYFPMFHLSGSEDVVLMSGAKMHDRDW